MSRGLIDTSVVIDWARDRGVEIPDEASISALTLCGLHHGVLIADEKRRPGRLAALALVERNFQVLPVDESVAPHYGRLLARARAAGLGRPGTADALIAATAISRDLPLYTRDRDFERMEIPALVLV